MSATSYDDEPSTAERLNVRADTDARGNTTRTFSDGMGRVVRVEDPPVNGVTYRQHARFDARVKRLDVDKKGYVTRYRYDAVYRLDEQVEEDTTGTPRWTQTWAFNDDARTVTQFDRSGIRTVATADGLGRVVETRRGTSPVQVVKTVFDADGRQVENEDANQHKTRRVFDGAGRLVREAKGLVAACGTTCADREESVFTHDGVGNVLTVKSRRVTGSPWDVRSTYDGLNREVRTETPPRIGVATSDVTSKAYDAAGNLLCVRRPQAGGHQVHGWAAGKTVDEVAAVACGAPGAQPFVTKYTWDEVGKQTSVQDGNGSTWAFRYDAARNLVAKLDANQHLTTYGYDARNQRVVELQHLANGQTLPPRSAAIPYANHNTAFTSGTLRTQWTYDGNGQLEDEVDAKGQLTHHEYGVLKRLERVVYSGHVAPRALPSMDSVTYTYRGEG
ncbi:MAG: RHS repeat protein, partial [Myxococcaceae bacterium]|nr:RHS repeat protein [Myxococcaceae bacterium]